ncbi:bacteriohemerythrin [Wukongibacter baidiensis]|uniref:bacteriohemerythrin n=1 Tax=Wukongibacter baidiensis TaxID=1723361 RepID=UPI003D7F5DA2
MFKWRENYSCNIEEIDKQHERLLEIGSDLSSLIRTRDVDHYDEIIGLLDELKKYTIYHFKTEEDLMEKYGFDGLDEHKQVHQNFIDKVNEVGSEDIDENQKGVTMEILVFIADWIENHILKVDHMYKDFLNEKGVF